jgi:hypothetical protein
MTRRIHEPAENPSEPVSETRTRQFENLNHPEPEQDGTFLYDVYEHFPLSRSRERTIGNRRRFMRGATRDQMEAFVRENGEWRR